LDFDFWDLDGEELLSDFAYSRRFMSSFEGIL
jgi:hypothetical protein